MSAFSPSDERLKQLIEQIGTEAAAEVRNWDELMNLTEALMLEVGVQQYLGQRKARMVELEQQFEEQIRGKAEEKPSEEARAITVETPPPAPQLGDEIKVLPDPVGPPVHHSKRTEESLNEDPIEEAAPEKSSVATEKPQAEGNWNLGLNDKIALTKNLFDGNSQDLMRVLSQVETMDSFATAKSFVLEMVQADYNWTDAGEHVDRFLDLIEAFFLHKNVKS